MQLESIVAKLGKRLEYAISDSAYFVSSLPGRAERWPFAVSHPCLSGLAIWAAGEAISVSVSLFFPNIDVSGRAYGITLGTIASTLAGLAASSKTSARKFARANSLDVDLLNELVDRRMFQVGNYSYERTGKPPSRLKQALRPKVSYFFLHRKFVARAFTDIVHYKDREKMFETMSEYAKEVPGLDSTIISALFLKAFSEEEAAQKRLGEAFETIRSSEDFAMQPLGERGIHAVYRYGPNELVRGNFLFKEEHPNSAETSEASSIMHVQRLNKNPYYGVPLILRNQEGLLILYYIEGKSPAQLHAEGRLRPRHIEALTDYLAWIHASVSPEMSTRGRVDIEAKVAQAVYNPHFGLAPQTQGIFLKHFTSLLSEQKSSRFVFAKDPHPLQWLFAKNKLIALDWEDKGATSVFFEIAKLFAHPGMPLSADAMEAALAQAQNIYDGYGLAKNSIGFRISMLNTMLFQPFSFASAWSIPEMGHAREERADAVAMTRQTFDMLRQNHPRQYSMNRQAYESLQEEFTELERRLAMKS